MIPSYRNETAKATAFDVPFESPPSVEVLPPPSAPRGGLFQACSIHPGTAIFALVVDSMLFGVDGLAALLGLPTGGISLFLWAIITCCAGGFVGYVTFKGQVHWAGDSVESAKVKGLMTGFLVGLPTAIPAALYIPMGVAGLVHQLRRRA
jgi:hypothetical protein